MSIGENLIEYYAQIDDIYDMPPETRFSISRGFFSVLRTISAESVLVTSPGLRGCGNG